MNAEEIKLLQAQNEGYRKQNKSLQKENAALKGIIDAYKSSENEANEIIAELKAENEQLKKDIRTEKIYSSQIEELEESLNHLKQKNERLKEKIKMYKSEDTRKHNVIMETLQNEKKALDVSINYKQTLQEVKAIAEAPKPFIDFSVKKTATEVEYDYAAICNELELRLHKVLELITKADEELKNREEVK